LVACTEPELDLDFQFGDAEVTMKVGDTYTLEYTLTEGFELEFSLSEEGIISISNNTVTALAVGEVTVTATVKGTEISDTIKVIVEEQDEEEPVNVPVTSVTVTGTSAIKVGETTQLIAAVLPLDATNKTVTWSSSNQTIATVSNSGLVTALKVGTVTITATADGKSGTLEVVISEHVVAVESIT